MKPTSREAHESIQPALTNLQSIVLGVCQRLGSFIDEDLFRELGSKMTENTIRPRRGELVTRGLIRDTGEKRKNSRNRNCVVWEVCQRVEEQATLFEMPNEIRGAWEQ